MKAREPRPISIPGSSPLQDWTNHTSNETQEFQESRIKTVLGAYSLWHFRFRIYWGINYKCLVFRPVLRYIAHVLHRFFVAVIWGLNVTSNDTRYSMMETKEPDFVSTMSRTIKCNHCSKLPVNQQGLFYAVKKKKKIVLYLQMLQHTKLYLRFSKISASALFLKLFLKFRKFQPRYSYKIYYKKECMCQAAHQASTDHRLPKLKIRGVCDSLCI